MGFSTTIQRWGHLPTIAQSLTTMCVGIKFRHTVPLLLQDVDTYQFHAVLHRLVNLKDLELQIVGWESPVDEVYLHALFNGCAFRRLAD